MSVRNVVLLSLENDLPATIIRQIGLAGWKVLTATNVAELEVLLGQHDCRVGLVCLDELADSVLPKVEECMLANHTMEWIAVVSPETLQSSRICRFIKDICHDYHSKPVEVERLLFALGHLYGKTGLSGTSGSNRRRIPIRA